MNKKEEFCKLNKWRKTTGIKIDNCYLEDDYDNYFIEEGHYKTNVVFWVNEETEMGIYTDIDELIEYIEDYSEISFEDFKKQK